MFFGKGGGGNEGWWYAFCRMRSIVTLTGTLVKRLSTSSDASSPFALVALIKFKNSSVDSIMYLAGRYCFRIEFNFCATL